MERWVSTAAGRHLAGRRKKNTAPEIALRKALHAAGARFRLHRQIAKGCTPDIVLPRRSIAIFVDGCFWHGCPEHGRRTPWTGPNASLWEAKLARNVVRDHRSTQVAQDHGWQVVRVWECTVTKDPRACAAQILSAVIPRSRHPSREAHQEIRDGAGQDGEAPTAGG